SNRLAPGLLRAPHDWAIVAAWFEGGGENLRRLAGFRRLDPSSIRATGLLGHHVLPSVTDAGTGPASRLRCRAISPSPSGSSTYQRPNSSRPPANSPRAILSRTEQ